MGKIGAGTLKAMWRQGLKEFRAVFFPGSNIAREAETGMYGTATQSQISTQLGVSSVKPQIDKEHFMKESPAPPNENRDLEIEPGSQLDTHLKEAAEMSREAPSEDRDIEPPSA